MRYRLRLNVLMLFAALMAANSAKAELSVFACEPEWKSLVEEIGREHVDVYAATTGMQDPHHVEARPSLIAKARTAEMLVCTGGELEIGWLPVVQRRSGNPRIQEDSDRVFYAADVVERLEIPASVDRSQGDVHASGNPHVHLDPHRIGNIAAALAERLQAVDPANAEAFARNHEDFDARWRAAIADWESRMADTQGTHVITHHRAWSYLFDWIGWHSVGELEPLPGIPPTTKHLAELVDATTRDEPSLIVLASYQDPRGARWFSDRTGLPVVPLPSTIGGSTDSQDLFSLFETIVDRLGTASATRPK